MGATPLQNQARIYTDRAHLKFTTVPKSVTGLSYLMAANADHKGEGKTFLTFAVNQSVRLWVGRDSRGDPGKKGTVPKWLSSDFQRTDLKIETNEPGMVFFVLYPASSICFETGYAYGELVRGIKWNQGDLKRGKLLL